MGMDYAIIEEAGSIALALGTVVSGTIPAGFERIGLLTTGNCHWRMGKGAQTAVTTDPMLTPNSSMVVVKVKPTGSGLSDTISVIADVTTPNTGFLSVFGIRES